MVQTIATPAQTSHMHIISLQITFITRVLFVDGLDEATDIQFFVLFQKTRVKGRQVTIFVVHTGKQKEKGDAIIDEMDR